MKKFLKLLTFGALVVLASCMMDPSGGKKNRQPETLSAEMSLTVPGSFNDPATRALTDAQECAVEDAYVLVFSAANELEAMVEIAADKIRPNDQTKVTLSAELPSGSHRLAVIVNAAALIESALGTDASAVADKSYAGVMGKLTQTIDGKMFASGGTIPMWGETPEAVTIATASHFDIDLVRSIARVDVGVGKFENGAWDDMDIPFTITEVYLMRPVKGYSVVPDAAKFAADEPSLPSPAPGSFTAEESEAAFAFTDNITGGKYLSQNIYTPETPVAEVHHLEQTALVVGGKYGTGEAITYYRLNFADSEGTLVEVQRNHLYRFQISEVLGMGYEDPATAYNAYGQSKMKATVLDWDDELFEDITFVGDAYIGSSTNTVAFTAWANQMKTVTLSTNLFEFTIALGGSEILSSETAEAAGAPGQVVTTDWFIYNLKKGTDDEWTLDISPVENNIAVSGGAKNEELVVSAVAGVSITKDLSVSQEFLAGVTTPPSEVRILLSNGYVTFAGSNLIENGLFAPNEADYGSYFQWGRNVAYGHPGNGVMGLALPPSDTDQTGNATWPGATNPCPANWRVPTREEWESFLSVMTDGLQTDPRTFTHASYGTLTIPAGGYVNESGLGGNKFSRSGHASSDTYIDNSARQYSLFHVETNAANVSGGGKTSGSSIRCVKETVEMPAPAAEAPYIIYWDDASETMALGSWNNGPGGNVTQANMLFFQFGSTIGFLNQEAAASGTQNFDASDIKFNLTTDTAYASLNNWTDWFTDNSITYAAATHGVDGYVSSAAYHSASNVQAGRGDPCKLVGLTIAQIKAGTIDNGKWRLPTYAEQQTEGWAQYTGYGAYPTVNTINTPAGVRNSAGGFLPDAGNREADGTTYLVGRVGNYWFSRPNNATSGYVLSFYSSVFPSNTNNARNGDGVRCLSSDIDTRGSADNWGNGGEHDLRR